MTLELYLLVVCLYLQILSRNLQQQRLYKFHRWPFYFFVLFVNMGIKVKVKKCRYWAQNIYLFFAMMIYFVFYLIVKRYVGISQSVLKSHQLSFAAKHSNLFSRKLKTPLQVKFADQVDSSLGMVRTIKTWPRPREGSFEALLSCTYLQSDYHHHEEAEAAVEN